MVTLCMQVYLQFCCHSDITKCAGTSEQSVKSQYEWLAQSLVDNFYHIPESAGQEMCCDEVKDVETFIIETR